jgi:hypothetical protein
MQSFLKLEVVWNDDDMFELEITASNGRFSGTTKVYEQREPLYNFASSLVGFPKTIQESTRFYEMGQKDLDAYFSMRLYLIDNIGHVGVQMTFEDEVPTQYRSEEKYKLTMEIVTEPGLLENFVRSLLTLAQREAGQAVLEGVR